MLDTAKKRAESWLESTAVDDQTKFEVQSLLDGDTSRLEDHFGMELEFGTGGLRGKVGAGTNRMNVYTVRQATEGLARTLKSKFPQEAQVSVVIGYDCRNGSVEFSNAASEVLAAHGFHVYLFRELSPTPQVAFELKRRNAHAAIIVTASHNPPEYNGYKVYWQHGGQVVPPEDQEIIDNVRQVQSLADIHSMSMEEALSLGRVSYLESDVDEDYLNEVQNYAHGHEASNANTTVVYTALHGTGQRLVPELLRRQGFKVICTPQQSEADGDFSTVKSPNPEDPDAFLKAMEHAPEQADVILANDPDADRLGVMVKHQGKWVRLNGNQIGVLLLDHYLSNLQKKQKLTEKGAFVTTIVSSPMAKEIAASYGVSTYETLTGFKWIWSKAQQLKKDHQGEFLFGMEESHGYLVGDYCGDKDGVWAAMGFSEVVACLKAQQSDAVERLEQLYQKHGYYLEDLETKLFEGAAGVQERKALMSSLRESPPREVGGVPVQFIDDLLSGDRIKCNDGKVVGKVHLPSSDVLVFELTNQSRVIVRPSGTEPKVKYYFQVRGDNLEQLQRMLTQFKQELL